MKQILIILILVALTACLVIANVSIFNSIGFDLMAIGIFGMFDIALLLIIWGWGYGSLMDK